MKIDDLTLLVAKTMNRELFAKGELTDKDYLLVNAADTILNLSHPKLTCMIREAMERTPLMIRRINAQEKMLIAYRVGSSKIAEKVFDEMKYTENALTLPDGRKIEVRK